jgi:hypothetical protein
MCPTHLLLILVFVTHVKHRYFDASDVSHAYLVCFLNRSSRFPGGKSNVLQFVYLGKFVPNLHGLCFVA